MNVTKQKRKQEEKTPLIEWLLGAIGVALFAACVVYLTHEGLSNGEQPGAVTASVIEIVEAGDAHIVTFDIHNSGSQTLSNLQVSARLLDGNREVERASTMLDYLPGRSSQRGGFYLRNDPNRFRLEIVPEGYLEP